MVVINLYGLEMITKIQMFIQPDFQEIDKFNHKINYITILLQGQLKIVDHYIMVLAKKCSQIFHYKSCRVKYKEHPLQPKDT